MLFCFLGSIHAQTEQTLCEVTVRAIKPERFMVGLKVNSVDSVVLAQNKFSTLANFLQYQSPVSFKSLGAGQTATVSFRGTSPSHTALLWNGLNINAPSLGLTDFSTVPLTGFDEMSIQYGSAASCVGTDAVGGSILLNSAPKFAAKGQQFISGISVESSKNLSFQTGLRFHSILNKFKFSGKSLIYGSLNKNEFGPGPISKPSGRSYPVEPTQTNQSGLVQDFYLLSKKGNLLSLNLWYTDNKLEIQPEKIPLRELTKTVAFRSVLTYTFQNTQLKVAHIRDIMDYGKAENLNPSHTAVDRYIFKAEHDFSWVKNCDKGTNLKLGFENALFNAQVDGYGEDPKVENRTDFYALLRHQFSAQLKTSLNLRQALVSGYNPPFTPSFGVDYQFFSGATDRLSFLGNIAYSYRVPTLNERFWLVLGNPDIKPEFGLNKDLGLIWKRRATTNRHQQYGLSLYHNLIDNWTYWNPERNYRVENLQQVLAKGVEIDGSNTIFLAKSTVKMQMQYAFNHSSQQKTFGAYTQDLIGKQLVYVPKHSLNANLTATSGLWTVAAQQLFQSKRYVTFDNSGTPFPPYYLLNTMVGYRHKSLQINIQANNLTNTLYPSLKKNAMPMRSVLVNLIFIK